MTDMGFLSAINTTRKLDKKPLLSQIQNDKNYLELGTVGEIGANFFALIPLINSASHHTFSETTWSEQQLRGDFTGGFNQ